MKYSWKILSMAVLVLFFGYVSCSLTHAAIVFSISNPIVGTDDEIEVDATISGLTSSNNCSVTGCYLQAELQSAGGSFGYTFNNSGEFVDYFSKAASIEEIKSKLFNFAPIGGYWTGKLKAKNNPESKNYYGPGEYLLSFKRFSGNSTSPTAGESNGVVVKLVASLPLIIPIETSTPLPEVTPTPFTFAFKTVPPSTLPITLGTPIKTPISSIKLKTPDSTTSAEPFSILGVHEQSDPSPTPKPESGDDGKVLFLPLILIIAGLGLISFSIFSIIKRGKKGYTEEGDKQNFKIS
jgi:hypothetical protein